MYDIVTNYGLDIIKTTIDVLERTNLKNLINKDMNISIKPNVVLSRVASEGATTHIEVVEAIIIYLREIGIKNIDIIESSWIGDKTERAFRVCGYDKLAEKYNLNLFDLKKDTYTLYEYNNLDIAICDRAMKTDFLINVPVLKAHCQTSITCCMKNLKGCIPDSEKRNFHKLGLFKPIAYLNKILKSSFNVIDAICGDLTFEEGGNPIQMNMIIAGKDPLLLDSYCATLLGYKPYEIEYLKIAHNLNIGEIISDQTKILEINKHNIPKHMNLKSDIAKNLSRFINEKEACSACYSSLIFALYKLEDKASVFKNNRINIGQGFVNYKSDDFGVGNCTSKCLYNVKGCPPKAVDIVNYIEKEFL